MNKRIIIWIILALTVGVGGIYTWIHDSPQRLKQSALEELDSGNYVAALALYDKIQEEVPGDTEIEALITQAQKLLIARENFLKAQQTAEQGEWYDVRALLEASEAMFNSEFAFHKEAIELSERAGKQIAYIEEEVANRIGGLEQTIAIEKSGRKQAEQKKSQIEIELQRALSQKQQTEGKLTEEQKKTAILVKEAEQERFEKFLNELKIYVEMLSRGDEYLTFTISEIDQANDIAALLFLSQSKVLFQEVETNVLELRSVRTPPAYNSQADDMVRAASLLLGASTNLRNAIIYIENKQGNDFIDYFSLGKSLKAQAKALLDQIRQFIKK